ncbi:hypothetical protein RS030_162561 [Cryptosporidium xiaoi]|uniref:Uncharacterized protein n=1 Tax=Cryptosporidium xiaoi TaxID=659607 RepID=A0AAV9Y043_9CRYT
MEQGGLKDDKTEDKHVTSISGGVDTSFDDNKPNTSTSVLSTVEPATIVTEIDKVVENNENVSDFREEEGTEKVIIDSPEVASVAIKNKDKRNDHKTHEPKKKKRRQSVSSQGSSLHTLLHGSISNFVTETSDKDEDRKNENSVSFNQSEDAYTTEIKKNDRNLLRKGKKLKSLGSKKKKFHDRHENMFINDEADETDEYDDIDERNVKSSENERGLKRKSKLHSSSENEDDDEDEDGVDEDGYEELRDFITDEVEYGIDDQTVYNRTNFDHSDKTTDVKNGHLLDSGDVVDDDEEDDDDDEILRGDLEEDDLELIEENTGIRLRKDKHSQKHRLRRVSEADGTSGKTLVGKDIGDLEDLLFSGVGDGDEVVGNPYVDDNRLNTDLDNDEIYDEDDDDDGWMVYDTDEKSYKGDEYSMIQSVFGDYDTVMDILMNKFHKYKAQNKNKDDETHIIGTETEINGSDNTLDSVKKKDSEKEYYELDEDDEALFRAPDVDGGDKELERLQDRIKNTTLHTLHSIAEPSEIQGQYLTDFDTEVKEADVPERLYLLYNGRWKSLSGGKITKEELQVESNWITKKFLQTYPDLFKEDYIRRTHTLEFKSSFPYSHGGSMFQMVSKAVCSVLDWILNERFDIPYICLHKIHLVYPPLNEFLIGKIVFLDSVYHNLKLSIGSLREKLFSKMNSKTLEKYSSISEADQNFDNDEFTSAFLTVSGLNEVLSIKSFDSNRDVDQLRLYLTYHIETQRFRQIINMDSEDGLEMNVGKAVSDSGRKQRKNFLTELFEYIENNKLYNIWNQYIVSPYVLSLYMRNFSSPQFHCSVPTSSSHKLPSTFSLLPPVGPVIENSKSALNKWFEKYIVPESPNFFSSEKIIESLIIYEAKRLSTFPIIRTKIYEYFFSNACITTVTTVKGEQNLIPNNTGWLAGRIFRKPINTLFPGTYLPLNDDINDSTSNFNALFDGCLSSQIFELEKLGLINVVIHPLCFDEEAPWRGSDGEAKIKERFLHQVGMFKMGSDSNSSYNNLGPDGGNNLGSSVYSKTNTPIPTPIQNRFDQEMRMFRNSDNIDNRIVRNILDELKYGYVSVSGSVWSKQIQVPILHKLIEELFPAFRKDVLNYMKSRSQEYIAELCSLNLQRRLRLLPPKRPTKLNLGDDSKVNGSDSNDKFRDGLGKDDDDFDEYEYGLDNLGFGGKFMGSKVFSHQKMSDSDFLQPKEEYNTNWGLNIISCVVEKAQNGFKVCVTALDIFGELKDYLILNHLLISGSSINKFSNIFKNDNHYRGDTSGSIETQRFEEDLENLVKFSKTYFPHYICIGVSNMKSLELGSLWGDVVLKKVKRKDKNYIPGIYFVCMDVSKALVRKKNSESDARKGNEGHPIPVEMAISVGRLVQNPLAEQLRLWDDSNNEIERELNVNIGAKNESCYGSNNNTVRYSGNSFYSDVSGGRNGFNLITCLKLHKYQDSVDSKLLQFHLLMAIRSVVSNLGVQINRMKGHQHLQSPLKFVSGLGPRKARLLSFYLDSVSEPILNRSQLKLTESEVLVDGKTNSSSSITPGLIGDKKNRDNYHNSQYDYYDDDYQSDIGKKGVGCLTKNIYLNSHVFLRVDEESIYEKGFNKNLNIFDISRLSDIDDSELAKTILGNIKDMASEEGCSTGGSGGKQRGQNRELDDDTLYWSWISKRGSKLETLDLEAYAKLMYENRDIPRLLPYLNRMLMELKKPYDCSYFAKVIKGMDRSRQVREAMQISKEDLFIGSEITCRVTGVATVKPGGSFPRNPVSFWFDQYGMKVVVEDFDNFWYELMDENPMFQSVPLASIFKVNTPLQATVTNIDFVQNCVFVSLSQGKICNTLNFLIETVWRQQQARSENMERDNNGDRNNNTSGVSGFDVGSGSSSSSTSVSTQSLEGVSEFQRNNFNILQDDLSSLLWTDIRHYAYILFKRNLNVISNCSRAELNSLCGDSDFKDGAAGRYLRGAIHRTIHHPNYRTWNHDEVMNYMKDDNITIGEVVIKSSNRYIDKLIMYVKVCDNPFMVKIFNIDEFDQRLPGELGRRLKIEDSEFNDIDQILIQYVHPLKVHLSTVYTHSKYRANMEYQNLVSELLVESTRSGNSIVWGIVADKQIPCRFHLISVPPNTRVGSSGARIHFEDGIYVSQKGFQLWRKSETTLRKLLNWWKTEGFFRRSHYLEEYRRYKESMVREKQGIKDAGFHHRRFGPSSNNYYQHGGSGYGGGGHGGFYQNQRYSHDTHGYYSNRGYGSATNDGYGTNFGGVGGNSSNNRNHYRR